MVTRGSRAAGSMVWTSEPSRSGARRRRLLVALASLALVGGGVAGSWWWMAGAVPRSAPVPVPVTVSVPAPTPTPAPGPVGTVPRLDRAEHASDGKPVTIAIQDALRVEVTGSPSHGTAAVQGTDVIYGPEASHIGLDRVGVRACNDAGCADLWANVRTGRPGLSSLRSVETRGLVRRANQPLGPGASLRSRLPAGATAVAVSVTVHGAARAGAVTLDAGAGPVVAVRARRAGATTTNVVIVPAARNELTVTDGPGGGLSVDLVGTFLPTAEARDGRFVAVQKTRVADLDTARDGRDATVAPARYGAGPGIRAALVLVTAEIGTQTAWVDFARSPGRVDRRMTWGAGPGGRERRAVALVPVDDQGAFSLNYQHGSRISVDVIGYFTGDRAEPAVSGLYVPTTPTTIFDAVARSDGRAIDVPAAAGAVAVTLAGRAAVEGPLDARDVGIAGNRTIGTVLPAGGGRVTLRAQRPLPVRVDLVGYFVR